MLYPSASRASSIAEWSPTMSPSSLVLVPTSTSLPAAVAAGRKLGAVVSVNDNGNSNNVIYPMAVKMDGLGGGAPVESGSTTIYKTITVSFELK